MQTKKHIAPKAADLDKVIESFLERLKTMSPFEKKMIRRVMPGLDTEGKNDLFELLQKYFQAEMNFVEKKSEYLDALDMVFKKKVRVSQKKKEEREHAADVQAAEALLNQMD